MGKNIEDELAVFRLALLTEDRSNAEQGAMRRVGKRLEKRWNKQTITNEAHRAKHGDLNLADEIEGTWDPEA